MRVALHWPAMRALRCLAVLVAACTSVLAAAPAQADVTPEAFGNCGERAAKRAVVRAGLPAIVERELPEGFELSPRPYSSTCQDLNGDDRRDLVVEMAIKFATASSPTPWAILEVPRGRTEPRVAFHQSDVGYLTLFVRRNYVVEHQKTFRGNEPNCCPAGPPQIRFVRWTGTRFEYTTRKPPDEDVPEGPPDGYGVPPPSGEAGCEGAVQAGPLELRAIFITKVRAGLVLEPQFGFSGGMALSAGPRVLGVTAASVDGTFTYQGGTPGVFMLSGDISLVRVKLAGGELAYRTNGQITMRGNLDLTLGGVGFQGDLAGFVDGLRAFSAEGSGTVGFKGKGAGGEGIVSSVGAAA